VNLFLGTVFLLLFTLFGGLQWLAQSLLPITGGGMTYQISLLAAFALLNGILDLPLAYYAHFVLEQRFGFNHMSVSLWLVDILKNTVVSVVLFLPLAWVVLLLMEKTGNAWWIYAWVVVCAFQLLVMLIYPTLIAPLFNKFVPLQDESLKQRIEGLMQRVGFKSSGLFVMDGSKHSAHGNAYFSGFGRVKRIVFYDTLLSRLAPQEIEAVLAHELGHFKLKHIGKRIVSMFALSLGFFALIGFFKGQAWFYTGLGVTPLLQEGQSNDAMALILFMLALPIFMFVFSPLGSLSSRKHEFEADAFAAKHTAANDLISALVKMYQDNASTLTPDPLHSSFYDSHPPASIRIAHLKRQIGLS
jgi:STE24 endopeptidase